jgi:hypothetical protein
VRLGLGPYHGHDRASRLRVFVGALSAVTLFVGYLPGIRRVGDVGALERGSEERALAGEDNRFEAGLQVDETVPFRRSELSRVRRLAVLSRVGQG